jgi:hypothetical protein
MKTPNKLNNFGNTAIHLLLGIIVLVAIGFVGWRIVKEHNSSETPVIASHTSTQSTTSSVPLASGTDNASLNSDLNAVNSSLGAESQSSSSANSSLNDSHAEIQVPTN